jgi:nucleoside-diphosphate-sugar epimerase
VARVLVTGASGFVGRAAVAALAARGHEVHGVARSPAADVTVASWRAADLLEPGAPGRVTAEVAASHLLHLAWTTEHRRFWQDPANLDWEHATVSLLEAFAAAGGERAVMVGSCAQYDWDALAPDEVASEARTPRRPATLYGRAKQSAAERAERVGISYATALVFFPYGPYDQPTRLVPSVARSLAAGEEARVSAGSQVRDFVHVSDVGSALAALLDCDVSGDVNVGTGRGVSVAEVATSVARLVGREDLLRLGALAATDDAPAVVADVTRLRDDVGFEPHYDLERGLRETVEWWLSESDAGSRPVTR